METPTKVSTTIPLIFAAGTLAILASIGISSYNPRREMQAPTLESCRPRKVKVGRTDILDLDRNGTPDLMTREDKKYGRIYAINPNQILNEPLPKPITAMTSQEIFEATQALEVSARLHLQRAETDYMTWKQTQAARATSSTNDLPYHKIMEQQVPGTQ
ncbi:hypothetical protein FJZ17_03785 [Candidatus Pacearchaeota archaeon]|nr:hypothetical protein [Candidatus Pacearchaeota archaeon]